jgi:isopenicillin N synthase-like dioxygenase
LVDFDNRKEEITKQLVDAAETAGFFTLVDHGITIAEIEKQFALSKAFFDLPAEVKGKTPHDTKSNNGWEYKVDKACRMKSIYNKNKPTNVDLGSTASKHGNLRSKGIPLDAAWISMAK